MSTADDRIVGSARAPRPGSTGIDGRPHRNPWSAVLLLASLTLIGAFGLGNQEFRGTFGGTALEKDCGSVWGLPFQDDLNATTCRDDLEARLTLVSAMLGAAGVGVGLAFAKLRSRRCPAFLLSAVVVVPIVSAVAMAVAGRQLIWSVSGG